MAGAHHLTFAGLAVGLSMVAIVSVLLLGAHESSVDEVKLSRAMSSGLLEMRGKPSKCGHVNRVPALDATDAKKWHLRHLSVFIRHGDRTRCSFQGCWKHDSATFDCLDGLQGVTRTPRGTSSVKAAVLFRKTFAAPGNVLSGTCSLGQLTAVGHKQLLYTGRQLREAYKGFLPPKFTKDKFFLRACNEPRTLESGEAFVEGMYPHLRSKQDESELVNFNVHDAVRDEMFPNFHVCPRLNRAVAEARATKKFKKHLKKVNKPLQKELKKLLGHKVLIGHINDCATTHVCHKQAVPEALTATVQDKIYQEVTSHYDIIAAATRKFASGPLVGTLLGRLKSVLAGSVPQKLDLYSGHDTGPILPLLHAFNVSDGKWPPYASMIVFELYESAKGDKTAKKDNMVRMVYNGKVLSIPGCDGTLCPWSKFESIAAAVVPTKAECVDKEMGGKMVHWDGMYAASFSTDMFGVNRG